jgi:hypothetical protein
MCHLPLLYKRAWRRRSGAPSPRGSLGSADRAQERRWLPSRCGGDNSPLAAEPCVSQHPLRNLSAAALAGIFLVPAVWEAGEEFASILLVELFSVFED